MRKHYLILVGLYAIVFFTGFKANAQTPPQNLTQHPRVYTSRFSAWFEGNFAGTISKDKRWQYQLDYQYRRMADASYIKDGQHANIFKDPYQQVWRPWIHWWLIPGQIRLSLSPIGYWITWTPPRDGSINKVNGTDKGKTTFPEFRVCPQITFNQNYGRFMVSNRLRYEFRFIGSRVESSNGIKDFGQGYDFFPGGTNGSNHQGRLRWQFRVQVPLTKPKVEPKTFYINAWNELFLGIGRHVGTNKMLNQNRVVALLGYRFGGAFPVKLEGGVTYQTIYYYNIGTVPTQPSVTYNNQNVEINTAFTVYAIFDEFHTLFKKKKKPEEKI